MNIIILTSSQRGSGAYQLKQLVDSNNINIKMVILNTREGKKSKGFIKKKITKIFEIGILGAFNGIRMRKWYVNGIHSYLDVSEIEETCTANNIVFKKTPEINCAKTIDLFKEAKADLGLSLGNGYIGSKVFRIPTYGMVNIHHEELPDYQNAQSIIWQIFNGSKNTGYTIHKIEKKIDNGDILFKENVPIVFRKNLSDTVSYNYARLWQESSKGLLKMLNNFDYYKKNAISQKEGNTYTTPTILQYLKIVQNFKKLKKEQTGRN